MMEEVLGNPEKMEQARQAILENPTLKQAMSQLPGFSDMVSRRPRLAFLMCFRQYNYLMLACALVLFADQDSPPVSSFGDGHPFICTVFCTPMFQIDSKEKWREQMEMALDMFKAQKAMLQQQEGGEGDGAAADVDDLDDD